MLGQLAELARRRIALTINNSGSGAASGTTFNGSAAVTLSYNTLGAAGLPANKHLRGLNNSDRTPSNGDGPHYGVNNLSTGIAGDLGIFSKRVRRRRRKTLRELIHSNGTLTTSQHVLYSISGEVRDRNITNQDMVLAVNATAVETVASTGVIFAQPVTISPSSGLVLSAMTEQAVWRKFPA